MTEPSRGEGGKAVVAPAPSPSPPPTVDNPEQLSTNHVQIEVKKRMLEVFFEDWYGPALLKIGKWAYLVS
jgi:hypothetical protein